MSGIPQRFNSTEHFESRWFSVNGLSSINGVNKRRHGKIRLKLCLEAGYHVSDCRHGDFQPSAKHMKKDSIGRPELAILGARGLPPMKKHKISETSTADAYCVVKYGNKWVRTRIVFNTREPFWNEQYVWEVYDPCTIVRIGIFCSCNINGSKKENKDTKIGKVCIQLQTLEWNRKITNYYPLLVIGPSGLMHHGELRVAIQFTCLTWLNMVAQYSKPLWPEMHYSRPLKERELYYYSERASRMVAASLSQADSPINKEVVTYMLDDKYNMWSLQIHKANFELVMSLVLGITAMYRWFNEIRKWRNPLKTIFIHFLYVVFVRYPKLILTTFFLSLSVLGMWNYRFRPRNPSHLDARLSHAETTSLDDLGEEFDTFPTSQPDELVKRRYDRLKSIAGRYTIVAGDVATQGEKAMAILTCTDLKATSTFAVIAFICVVFICIASFKVAATLFGLYMLRHPWIRSKKPSILMNLFNRLPSKMDIIL